MRACRWCRWCPTSEPISTAVLGLCVAEGLASFPADPHRPHRVLTAPGVTAVVAHEGADVVGFAYLQSDGEIQAHLSSIAVARPTDARASARAPCTFALDRAGGERVNLVTDTAADFYTALHHKRWDGFRIYPPFT